MSASCAILDPAYTVIWSNIVHQAFIHAPISLNTNNHVLEYTCTKIENNLHLDVYTNVIYFLY